MASRNRPRTGNGKNDAGDDEERDLWRQVRDSAKRGDVLLAESNAITQRIAELAAKQQEAEDRGDIPSSTIDREITDALRQNINYCEKLSVIIGGDDVDNKDELNILNSLDILSALRSANEVDTPKGAHSRDSKPLGRNPKRKHEHSTASDDRDSIAAESPAGGPSPKLHIATKADRMLIKSANGSRAGSVPAAREASVKAEETEDRDPLKAPATPTAVLAERHKLVRGTEVFYRNKAKAVEGEGILCSVTAVIGDGKQRRYEIIDSDPEPPAPPQPYRASVNHLVPIPKSNDGLPDLSPRKAVLALYPGTTTFYKAEVVQGDLKDHMVRLKFEGEEEKDREMDVERKYVLPDTGK